MNTGQAPAAGQAPVAPAIGITIAFIAPVLLLVAWNGFPPVYWDSSEYLFRWQYMRPGLDRPLFYSLWLAAFRFFPYPLHVVALCQAAVSVGLLAILARSIRRSSLGLLVGILAGTQLSPVAFHEATLMPDIGTSWIAIGVTLLAIAESTMIQVIASCAIAIAVPWHFSNAAIGFCGLVAGGIIRRAGRLPMRRYMITSGGIMVVVMTAFLWNGLRYSGDIAFRSPTTFFLAGRLQQAGVLAGGVRREWEGSRHAEVLHVPAVIRELENGPRRSEWLLWEESSPLNRWWKGWRDESQDSRLAEWFWRPVVKRSLRDGWREFVRSGAGNVAAMLRGDGYLRGYVPHLDGSGVARVVERLWSSERDRHFGSQQTKGTLIGPTVSLYSTFWARMTLPLSAACAICMVVGLVLVFRRRGGEEREGSAVFVLGVVYFGNLFACGLLGSDASRYNERVASIPILVVIVLSSRAMAGGVETPTATGVLAD